MNVPSYRFPLGSFICIALRDGAFNYPLESLFANAPRPQVEVALRHYRLPTDRVTTPYTCLFVDTGEHRVLIDTGAGALGAQAAQLFPGIDHTTTVTGELLGHLQTLGIAAADIDTVIITHAHPDHVGGTLDARGQLVFANARYYVGRDEWAFWTSEAAAGAPATMVAIARRNLEPMRARLTLIEDGAEVVPGIRAMSTPGHTPGHLALVVGTGGPPLLHIADVVLHPLHLEHPEWVPVFDLVPGAAAASKQRTFAWAVEQQALVFAHHFPPFPSLGHVRQDGVGLQWQPIGG